MKQSPAVFESQVVPDPSLFVEFIEDWSIKPDLAIKGRDDIRRRVARALETGIDSVTIDHFRYSPSKLSLRCTGTWDRKKFFAKILLTDPYPSPGRFWTPWGNCGVPTGPFRSVRDQIETEWNMTRAVHSLSGGECVPPVLGKSCVERTIVWEEVSGQRLDQALKRSCWIPERVKSGARAISRAGTWLRKIHDSSAQGTQAIDIVSVIHTLKTITQMRKKRNSQYFPVAIKILRNVISTTGKDYFSVPVALTHGDFSLPNLIWEENNRRLSVIDFEFADFRPICHDLFTHTSLLLEQLLNPLIPKSVILAWEQSFWDGYGPVPSEIPAFVRALSLSRIFYHRLPRLLLRGERLE